MNNTIKRIPALLLVLLLVTALLSTAALAAGKIDMEEPLALTIRYQKNGVKVSGAQFDIYKVADVDEYVHMTLTDTFAPYEKSVKGLSALEDMEDQDDWMELASTLKILVKLEDNKIQPDCSGTTDADGNLTFPTDNKKLTPGLYLVVGSRCEIENFAYTVSPFMVFLPGVDYENNVWVYNYDAVVEPKAFQEPISPEEETVTRKVLKVWDDEGNETARPKEIIVCLLCDGKVYDTVTLSAENDWRYTWSDLSGKNEWCVIEQAVEGYKESIDQNGITFVVTNSYEPPDNPPPPPPDNPNLPQTGALWWPVPVLLCGGIIFLIIGALRRRRYE